MEKVYKINGNVEDIEYFENLAIEHGINLEGYNSEKAYLSSVDRNTLAEAYCDNLINNCKLAYHDYEPDKEYEDYFEKYTRQSMTSLQFALEDKFYKDTSDDKDYDCTIGCLSLDLLNNLREPHEVMDDIKSRLDVMGGKRLYKHLK